MRMPRDKPASRYSRSGNRLEQAVLELGDCQAFLLHAVAVAQRDRVGFFRTVLPDRIKIHRDAEWACLLRPGAGTDGRWRRLHRKIQP